MRIPQLAALLLAGGIVLPLALVPPIGSATHTAHAADTPESLALKKLKSKEYRERLEGVVDLERAGHSKKAEKALVGMLGDSDWGVAMRACQALATTQAKDADDNLLDLAVKGEIEWLRHAAVEALAKLDPAGAVEKLTSRARVLRDETEQERAIEGAGLLATADDIGEFRPFLKSKEVAVAGRAAEALVRMAQTEKIRTQVLEALDPILGKREDKKHFFAYAAAITGLSAIDSDLYRQTMVTELLLQEDDDPYIPERIGRGFATQPPEGVADAIRTAIKRGPKSHELVRLARLTHRASVAPLREDMEKLLGDSEPRVRSNAARALIRIGTAESVPALLELLQDREWTVRVEAVSALAKHMERPAFHALADDLVNDDNEEVPVQYIVEIADHGDPLAIPALEKLVPAKAWRTSTAALATIGTLGIDTDLPLLLPYMKEKDWRRRATAFEAMGRLRARDAVPYLIEGLRDRDTVVVGVCHTNLLILCKEQLAPDPKIWAEWWEKNAPATNFAKRSRLDQLVKDAEAARKSADARYGFTAEERVEILQKARILVQIDAWDKVQLVLEHLGIKHTALRAQELKVAGLGPNQILLVNCAGNMDKDTMERVKWFVNVGGYCMTTDWALTKTVMPCFPGYMSQYARSSTGNDVVVVEDALPGNPLTQGVFDNVPALMWWLEIQAFPITVDYPERCDTLVDSAAMRQRYGSSTMATVFRWGLGKVQHSLSHFYLQEEGMAKASKPRDRMIFAADNLGLSIEQIRKLESQGAFTGRVNEEVMKQIAPDYSMFRLIVNFVREKSEWVENL